MRRAAFLAALVAGICLATPASPQMRCGVVDGDTLRCGGELVRIVGIDTPERHGRCPFETRLARQATDRLKELAEGGIYMRPRGRDRYGRLLAEVRDVRGDDVAEVMIREGLGRPNHGERRKGWCSP